MLAIDNIIKILEKSFPLSDACQWDFSGVQIKSKTKSNINKILVCLDITNDVVESAINNNIELIISHHPFLFAEDINQANISTWKKELYNKILKADINVYSLHTNFDISLMGMNVSMAKALKIKNINFIDEEKLAVTGNFDQQISLQDLIKKIKKYFNVTNIQLVNNKLTDDIVTVALVAGAGGNIINNLPSNIDLLITGEMKWNYIIEAKDKKINVILVGHYMEQKFVDFLVNFFNEKLSTQIKVFKYNLVNPIIFF
ncbi:Nif3-like dinuclear metal center hexameric protein [Spiroplasma endosymbiont of Polydrusus pterygomalis]|uniref:Nif3-like dinuclear metal center hexameric protein n=1 Tax=Spiroplasma endosymbiont of Polydrusus pterygomalis TaxID=3139327 RepID=UPI003CCB5027